MGCHTEESSSATPIDASVSSPARVPPPSPPSPPAGCSSFSGGGGCPLSCRIASRRRPGPVDRTTSTCVDAAAPRADRFMSKSKTVSQTCDTAARASDLVSACLQTQRKEHAAIAHDEGSSVLAPTLAVSRTRPGCEPLNNVTRVACLRGKERVDETSAHVGALLVREDGPVASKHRRKGLGALDVEVGV